MFENLLKKLPTLESDRIILRKLQYSDRDDIFLYARNPNVTKHVMWDAHKDIFDTILFLRMIQEAYSENRAAPWGIQLKSIDKIIGTVGFVSFDEKNLEAEIGYALSEKYWNQGIITESIGLVIKFGFEKMMLKNVIARCKPENIASYKVIEKFKFKYKGIFPKNMFIKGKFENMRIYTLSSEKFFKSNLSGKGGL